jgi:hypothetical protein
MIKRCVYRVKEADALLALSILALLVLHCLLHLATPQSFKESSFWKTYGNSLKEEMKSLF